METKTLLVIILAIATLAAAALMLARQPEASPDFAATAPIVPAADDEQIASNVAVGPAAPAITAAPELSAEQTASEAAPLPSAASTRRVIATYFHNTARCVTCRSIEQRSKEAIEAAFAPELASGQLTWRALNMEEKENEHYAIDYALPYASLVLAEMDGERDVRFKVLEETWDLIHKRQPLLEDYVRDETRAFLEGH